MTSYGTTIILTFGKYKGRSIRDVASCDYPYLAWVAMNMEEVDPKVLTEIWVFLTMYCGAKYVIKLQQQRAVKFSFKKSSKQEKPWEEKYQEKFESSFNTGTGRPSPTGTFSPNMAKGVSKESLDAMAVKWYRESAKKWHPDLCRGSGEPMKAVNECYDRLKELISKL